LSTVGAHIHAPEGDSWIGGDCPGEGGGFGDDVASEGDKPKECQ
jgi:hypothetical protein